MASSHALNLRTVPGWAFWLWAIVGVGFGLGISVLGLFTVPASVLVAIVFLLRPGRRESAYGALVGIGAVLVFVAGLNHEGPGTACHTFDHGRGVQCDELYDPRKWLAFGIVFIVAGVGAHVLRSRDG